MTAGRIMLHEIAHVVFADAGTSSEDPRKEEFRADEWADHWMLDKWTDYDSDERVFFQRCLGIASAHAPAVVLGFNPPRKSLPHPAQIARINRFSNRIPVATPTENRRRDFPAAYLWMISIMTLVDKGVIQQEVAVPGTYQEAFRQPEAHFTKVN